MNERDEDGIQDVNLEADDPNEILSDEDVVYQINTFGADFTVDGLVKRFERGDIFRPEFQRNFVWTLPQASKFVESILLGLPIPSVFLYREESSQKHLIVDGLQRLTTLHAFSKGRFKDKDKIFRLRGVKKKYENLTYEQLEPEDQRRFEDAVIHAMVIQQLAPDDQNSSVYHIFDRLNSNGTPLQPQEIRAAIFHGSFQNLLEELNNNVLWRHIFGPIHRRGKDQELILRFLALRFARNDYQKPMKGFLNNFMQVNRGVSGEKALNFKSEFELTISRAHSALGSKPFRPQRSLNISVFDSVMIGIAENPHASGLAITLGYHKLISDRDYLRLCRDATSDEGTVNARVDSAIKAIRDAADQHNF